MRSETKKINVKFLDDYIDIKVPDIDNLYSPYFRECSTMNSIDIDNGKVGASCFVSVSVKKEDNDRIKSKVTVLDSFNGELVSEPKVSYTKVEDTQKELEQMVHDSVSDINDDFVRLYGETEKDTPKSKYIDDTLISFAEVRERNRNRGIEM